MEKKKLCIKMFIIFASFFVLFILSNSNVFAAENDYTFHDPYFDKDVTIKNFKPISEDYKYHIVLCTDEGSSSAGGYKKYVSYKIAFSTAPIVCSEYSNVDGKGLEFSTKGSSYWYLLQNYDTRFHSSYNLKDESYSKPGVWLTIFSPSMNRKYTCISNHDVVDKDTGKTVFQKAKEPTQLTIIAKSMDFLAVIKEILGILPMILVVLIGLLALMKAIKEIFRMLQKA